MAGLQPVGVYALKVPPGDILVPAVPDFSAMFRVSMAAIDPSAEPEFDDVDDKKPPRATLKILRFTGDDVLDDSDDDEYDFDVDEDDEEDLSDDEINGGPSNKSKKDKASKIAGDDSADSEEDDESVDEEAAAKAIIAKLKGKGKANAEDEDDSDEDDDESLEVDEVVVCTLDPEKNYQQPIDITVNEDERIFFKVSGTHTIHLTGNYVVPNEDLGGDYDEDDEEDEYEYDLSPDEDELDGLSEDDELDDLADPRVMELDSDENEAPKLVKAAGKGKNKRPAEDSEEEPTLDDIISKAVKPDTPASGEEKLSKSQLKKLKKQKKNDGEAKAVSPEATKSAVNGSEKKVQFAKNLEQGPTPSPAAAKDAKKEGGSAGATGSLGVKHVGGVTIDDKKLGQGPAAKKGDRVGMRYIGKLENGKVFDSNKKGKPFTFKLGAGEVIKGWDIGIAGLAVGGERRITIPSQLAYGKKGAPPDIPANATLLFDVKLLEIK